MLNLISVEFTCETITPVISSGANQREFELRSASLKGLLRFWWRTFQKPGSIAELYKKESEIFGSSDQTVGASKVRLSLDYDPSKLKIIKLQTIFSESGLPKPLSYLLFSILKWNKVTKDYQFQRSLALAPFEFKLRMVMPEDYTSQVLNSFWLLYVFGGVGARTRRGFGAFKIKDIKAHTLPTLQPLRADELSMLEIFREDTSDTNSFIGRGLKKILSENVETESYTPFTSFMTKNKKILIGECKGNPTESLSHLAEVLKNYRIKNPSKELIALHSMISGKFSPMKFTKPASGLPIIYNFKSDRDHQIEVSGILNDTEYHRRSSPLMISLFEYKGDCCFTILHLPSKFLPDGAKLLFKVKERHTRRIIKTYEADYTQDIFVNSLINKLKEDFPSC